MAQGRRKHPGFIIALIRDGSYLSASSNAISAEAPTLFITAPLLPQQACILFATARAVQQIRGLITPNATTALVKIPGCLLFPLCCMHTLSSSASTALRSLHATTALRIYCSDVAARHEAAGKVDAWYAASAAHIVVQKLQLYQRIQAILRQVCVQLQRAWKAYKIIAASSMESVGLSKRGEHGWTHGCAAILSMGGRVIAQLWWWTPGTLRVPRLGYYARNKAWGRSKSTRQEKDTGQE
eukprot:1161700-Pelagomonas_calceolata.AAC.4